MLVFGGARQPSTEPETGATNCGTTVAWRNLFIKWVSLKCAALRDTNRTMWAHSCSCVQINFQRKRLVKGL